MSLILNKFIRFPTQIFVIAFLMGTFFLQALSSEVHAEQDQVNPEAKDSNSSTPSGKFFTATTTIIKNTKVNLSYYFDSRDSNTMNVLVNSTALPWGSNIF